MTSRLRLMLSSEDSARVRQIMQARKLRFRDRLWDHAPLLLLLHLLIQLPLLALAALGLWSLGAPAGSGPQAWWSRLTTSSTPAVPSGSTPGRPQAASGSVAAASGASAPVVAAGCAAPGSAQPQKGSSVIDWSTLRTASPGTLFGVDLSSYQGEVDWAKLKAAGVAFVFVKATEGQTVIDPCFASNWAGAAKAGIPRGAYHVYRTATSGSTQAAHFMAQVQAQGHPGELPPVLDLETSIIQGENVTSADQEIVGWLQAVRPLVNGGSATPLVYGSLSLFSGYLAGKAIPQSAVWLAEYTSGPAHQPQGWPNWLFWQFSASGNVPGVTGVVDLSRFSGTAADFTRLTQGSSPVVPASAATASSR